MTLYVLKCNPVCQVSGSHNLTGSARHCFPPVGSSDGRVMVEQMDGDLTTLTSLNWHLGLHTTLCYKVKLIIREE